MTRTTLPRLRWPATFLLLTLAGFLTWQKAGAIELADSKPKAVDSEPHRSPISLSLSADGSRMLTANQTADSVSLVDPRAKKVLAEIKTGEKPVAVAISADGRRGIVAHWYGYDVAFLDLSGDTIRVAGKLEVGPQPRGVAITPDGKTAYVAVGVANEVARIDLEKKEITGRVGVGLEPRGLALTPDGKRLVVSNARSRNVSVIATATLKLERNLDTEGDNLRQVAVSPDGKFAYVANMRNRGFATTKNNIDLGWVLGQRITRVTLDGGDDFATLTLDPRGEAASDAHGMAVSPDGKFLAVSLGGTHEVMIFRTDKRRLPFRVNGSRDLIPGELLTGDGRFRRVTVSGRPTELTFAPDGKTLYVANYLDDSIQVVDAEKATLTGLIELGSPKTVSLVRQGEAMFHDGFRSFNHWYSCNTCHSDGHTNGLDFDTMNDGWQDFSTAHEESRKKVPTMRGVIKTGPWTWHGWQKSLDDAMIESFTKSMQGPRPSDREVEAIVAYIATLEHPRNPYRGKDGSISESARRGQALFQSAKAACSKCHSGANFTDGKIHNAGLEDRRDVYEGYNPPSLIGVYDKYPYLHDGRAKTLEEALKGPHSPEVVSGGKALTDAEIADLVAYLKTL